MNDPAGGLPGQLLPHMHLVSRYRYPVMNMMPTETVVEYLINASKVVREHPMYWTFLDGPPDGTALLAWQPQNHLGTTFATDGYVWADAEQALTFETKGYTVEMWLHRSGHHPPIESIATHCRKRYRLTSPKVPNPNLAPPDPSLWLIHYSRAPQSDHIPANRIPITPQIQNMLAQRRFLQSQGQPARKDFMLHDPSNWPTINFPPQMGQQGFAQPGVYPNALMGRQQGTFYAQQQGPGVLGPKAPRGHRGSAGTMIALPADVSLEDEEVSAGDILDLLSPREISKMRYQQHHEWMEEVFASPYAIKQITPVDLGLGRKGELESLTVGFFEAPVGPSHTKDPKDAMVSHRTRKIEPEEADQFTERVTKRVADVSAEIEKLKKQHARRMEKVGRLSMLTEAELRLRDAAANPSETGPEIWRLEGCVDIPTEEGISPADYSMQTAKFKVDDIAKDLETAYGRLIVPEPNVSCVQKGGLLERIEPDQTTEGTNGVGFSENDIIMDNADHLLDQFGTPPASTLGQRAVSNIRESVPHASLGSAVPSSNASNITTDTPADTGTIPNLEVDVEMSESNEPAQHNSDSEAGDWVMVGSEDKPAKIHNAILSDKTTRGVSGPVALGTPGSVIQGLTPASTGDTGGLETSNFEDATEFSNIDSAGDALAAYSEQHDGLDLPDLDNSAFGDAFHASDNEGHADEMS
ncbi:hypothetical protein Egran_05059 [Elaphomyces granulatus]|uniref:DUF1750-domain-containing protein n=1 Tax=Elaphomyces granulatus TaxID=519963 RepID=A0A232LSN7_9EURO|nr:hypothetical protein Egran_05059 [Elaphomyces granulatus]